MDADYEYERGLGDASKETVIRIFGIDRNNHTYLIRVYGFLAYFYLKCPSELDTTKYAEIAKFFSSMKFNEGKDNSSYVKHEIVRKESLMNYKQEGSREQQFIKVYLKDPRHVAKMKEDMLEMQRIGNIRFDSLEDAEDSYVYEANMAFALRFMIDKGIVGMGWINLKNFEEVDPIKMKSNCQRAVKVNEVNITAHAGKRFVTSS